MADAELRQAFAQLQAQMVETQQRVSLVDAQAMTLQRSLAHASASLAQLATAEKESGASTRAYQPVGRCFVLQPLDHLKTAAEMRKKNAEAKLEVLKGTREHLERGLKNSENNLREMVQLRKEQAA